LYTGIGVVAGDAFLEWGRINELVTWGQILIMAAYVLLHCGVIAVGIRHFRLFVYAVAPIQCVFYGGILAWACTLVPLGESLSASEAGSSASAYAWFVGVNSSVAAWSALVLNIADLSRYCPTQKDQIIGQVRYPYHEVLSTSVTQ
jgi:cytosine/uracil/thiamine/allantoin permease